MEQYIKPAVWVFSTPEDLMETTLPIASPSGEGENPSEAEGKEATIFEEVELPAQENIWGDEE
ncbi:MAG: hypothetical protein IKH37_00170 [Prevotella sp.]|nr:hypothetical protein [Prevotella sp.]